MKTEIKLWLSYMHASQNFLNQRMVYKKSKRKVQGVSQSQAAALPRPQEEEETSITFERDIQHKISKFRSLFQIMKAPNEHDILKVWNEQINEKHIREKNDKSKYKIYSLTYRRNRKHREIQAWANSVDQDQTPQTPASHQGLSFCHSFRTILFSLQQSLNNLVEKISDAKPWFIK